MIHATNQTFSFPHGHTYICDGMVYRVSLYDIATTNLEGKDCIVTVEEHDVVCDISAYAELERIRRKSMT